MGNGTGGGLLVEGWGEELGWDGMLDHSLPISVH